VTRIEKLITFCGQTANVACDGNCAKAWGSSHRPRVQLSDVVDDFVWLADHELNDAPVDPGTYEGGDAKPLEVTGPNDLNRWCVRECERMSMSEPGEWQRPLPLRDFSRRLYNIPSSDPARWS
jgi:hypothetical protein